MCSVLLCLLAHQENVYAEDRNVISFRKVVKTMAASSDASEAAAGKAVEMISFHSVSKGFIGECGIRGGYFELHTAGKRIRGVASEQDPSTGGHAREGASRRTQM